MNNFLQDYFFLTFDDIDLNLISSYVSVTVLIRIGHWRYKENTDSTEVFTKNVEPHTCENHSQDILFGSVR